MNETNEKTYCDAIIQQAREVQLSDYKKALLYLKEELSKSVETNKPEQVVRLSAELIDMSMSTTKKSLEIVNIIRKKKFELAEVSIRNYCENNQDLYTTNFTFIVCCLTEVIYISSFTRDEKRWMGARIIEMFEEYVPEDLSLVDSTRFLSMEFLFRLMVELHRLGLPYQALLKRGSQPYFRAMLQEGPFDSYELDVIIEATSIFPFYNKQIDYLSLIAAQLVRQNMTEKALALATADMEVYDRFMVAIIPVYIELANYEEAEREIEKQGKQQKIKLYQILAVAYVENRLFQKANDVIALLKTELYSTSREREFVFYAKLCIAYENVGMKTESDKLFQLVKECFDQLSYEDKYRIYSLYVQVLIKKHDIEGELDRMVAFYSELDEENKKLSAKSYLFKPMHSIIELYVSEGRFKIAMSYLELMFRIEQRFTGFCNAAIKVSEQGKSSVATQFIEKIKQLYAEVSADLRVSEHLRVAHTFACFGFKELSDSIIEKVQAEVAVTVEDRCLLYNYYEDHGETEKGFRYLISLFTNKIYFSNIVEKGNGLTEFGKRIKNSKLLNYIYLKYLLIKDSRPETLVPLNYYQIVNDLLTLNEPEKARIVALNVPDKHGKLSDFQLIINYYRKHKRHEKVMEIIFNDLGGISHALRPELPVHEFIRGTNIEKQIEKNTYCNEDLIMMAANELIALGFPEYALEIYKSYYETRKETLYYFLLVWHYAKEGNEELASKYLNLLIYKMHNLPSTATIDSSFVDNFKYIGLTHNKNLVRQFFDGVMKNVDLKKDLRSKLVLAIFTYNTLLVAEDFEYLHTQIASFHGKFPLSGILKSIVIGSAKKGHLDYVVEYLGMSDDTNHKIQAYAHLYATLQQQHRMKDAITALGYIADMIDVPDEVDASRKLIQLIAILNDYNLTQDAQRFLSVVIEKSNRSSDIRQELFDITYEGIPYELVRVNKPLEAYAFLERIKNGDMVKNQTSRIAHYIINTEGLSRFSYHYNPMKNPLIKKTFLEIIIRNVTMRNIREPEFLGLFLLTKDNMHLMNPLMSKYLTLAAYFEDFFPSISDMDVHRWCAATSLQIRQLVVENKREILRNKENIEFWIHEIQTQEEFKVVEQSIIDKRGSVE